jgi:regulatory protein
LAERKRTRERPGAYAQALGLLARREHSARELERKLAKRGIDDIERGAALQAAQARRYQDDTRFAQALIRKRVAAGYGPRYIEAELRSHGIDPRSMRAELVAQDWSALARALVGKRFGRARAAATDRAKVAALLARRGFPAASLSAVTGAGTGDDAAE